MMSTGRIERTGPEEFRISIKQFSEQSKPKLSIRLLPRVEESHLNLPIDIFSLDGEKASWRLK
jgi:hypothetical protein